MSAPLLWEHRWLRICRFPACGLLVGLMLERPLHAQDRPDGVAGRPWLSAGLGAGRQELNCLGCARSGAIGGVALTAATGLTLPRNTGVALVAHRFSEFSFEYSQQSRYVLVLGQYAPLAVRGLTMNVGFGHGRYWGDRTPYVHRGSGIVGSVGVAFRAPAGSAAALSVSASYLAAFTGTREEDASAPVGRPLRPRLALIAASLSLAARRPAATRVERRGGLYGAVRDRPNALALLSVLPSLER